MKEQKILQSGIEALQNNNKVVSQKLIRRHKSTENICVKKRNGKTAGQRLAQSMCFTMVLECLSGRDSIHFQQLSHFFYKVQMPRCQARVKVTPKNTRLHLLNQNYIIIFDLIRMTKQKRLIQNPGFESLWNQQSVQVRDRVYMTGGAIANTKTYLKRTCVLDESTWCFTQLQDMHYQRDAHGVTKYANRYIIAVGSWHGTESTKTCEIYDTTQDQWAMLPSLNESTCAPGLIVMKDRYLYKLGGTSDIGKIEMLDLQKRDKWIQITTNNKFGNKHTINRCLLYQLPDAQRHFGATQDSQQLSIMGPTESKDTEKYDQNKFLVLGCHFGRSEKPFTYEIAENKYTMYSSSEQFIDMYRSNDVV